VIEKNYYEILEVRNFASTEVIKGAYKYLAQRWHPDKNPNDTENASEMSAALNEAYLVLSDPRRRAKFDANLRNQLEIAAARASANASQSYKADNASQSYKADTSVRPEPKCEDEEPEEPQHHTAKREQARSLKPPPSRGRFYIYLYALLFCLWVAFHFDMAGSSWTIAIVSIGAIGIVVAMFATLTKIAIRIVIGTMILCILLTGYTRVYLNASDDIPMHAGTSPEIKREKEAATNAFAVVGSSTQAQNIPVIASSASMDPNLNEINVSNNQSAQSTSTVLPTLLTIQENEMPAHSSSEILIQNVISSETQQENRRATLTMMPIDYPPRAIRSHHEGTVILSVYVDETGAVTKVEVEKSSGWLELDRAAERIRPLKVTPEYELGRTKATILNIPVKFAINE
jgi:TonB family protein